jgi:hypothetical protein
MPLQPLSTVVNQALNLLKRYGLQLDINPLYFLMLQVNPTGPPAKPAAPQQRPMAGTAQGGAAAGASGASMSAYGDVVEEDAVDEP